MLDSLGRSALFYAACQGHYDACAFLIDHRHEWANVSDRKGDTPMHVASYYKHNRIVELLVQSAVDVSIRNNKGYIPLHVTESVATLKLLIEYGSDVMSVCKKGRTALFCAAATGRIGCLRHLCSLATQYPTVGELGGPPWGHCVARSRRKRQLGLCQVSLGSCSEHKRKECTGTYARGVGRAQQPRQCSRNFEAWV